VADRQREEAEPDGQHDEVQHLMLLATGDAWRVLPKKIRACGTTRCGKSRMRRRRAPILTAQPALSVAVLPR
ncbi:MAG TPA: hypothetical protein VFJ46_21080, partial [Xanthobacteraceae bacterium]|nr:hypothetical protein [Xanthobacteraceae bacterium]